VPDADLINLFVEPLNRARLHYMVTGSVASMLYAEPRFTADPRRAREPVLCRKNRER